MGYKTYSCPVSKRCGGCQWLNVPYPIQLTRKQQHLEELLGKFGEVQPIVGMEEPLHYRNKILAPFAPGPKGRILYGLYEQGSHRIIPSDGCLVTDERGKDIFATIHALMPSFKITPYNEDTGEGLLRHVLVRTSLQTGEVMVTLVCNGAILPSSTTFVKVLRKKHPTIATVVMNINTRDTNVVLGQREKVLFGKGWIEDVLCECKFRISSQSFFQTNPLQTEKLYAKAVELAGLTGEEIVVDAYCGIGTIGIIAAAHAGHVIGVESNEDAVRDARANARNNAANNAEFICADATDFMMDAAEQNERADVVFMDPPRAGASGRFLEALGRLVPSRIVYISCNPQTLARDLEILTQLGYYATAIHPVDMFPHTPHVETVVSMSRVLK